MSFMKVVVKADGKTGLYRLSRFRLTYFGCSLRDVAFKVGNKINAGVGAPLYVRSDDLGGPHTRFIMTGSPGTSLELFTLDGKRLFSKTLVRPAEDAVGVEQSASLPKGQLLRLGDRRGITFLTGSDIVLFPNPDGVFQPK